MSVISSHNAGFFSCCSIKLLDIVRYINRNKTTPDHVDSSAQFNWYKLTPEDITYDYFEHYDNIVTTINYPINYNDDQFLNYSKLDYKIIPVIQKYFYPSKQILTIMNAIEQKYNLNYNNLCVLFYRGNDKNRETLICDYCEYEDYCDLILKKNPNILFFIQSDETEFIEHMTNKYPNSFYLKDEIRHIRKCNNTVDWKMRNEIDISSKNYLAITILMSKCKYIICGSGNCSMWIMFYRGHSNNVCQNLNSEWIINLNFNIGK